MKQNKSFKQNSITNKDYTTNQNLSKNYDKLNETNQQDFVSKKTNKLKFARDKSESTFEFRAPQDKNSYGGFKQKNRTHKFTKIFAGVSLATLITCGTVLGFAPIATGVAGSPSTSSSMSATAGAENAEDLKTHVAEYKADIESGKIKYAPSALGLDPANDPVLFTTESGLEIKMSNANPTVNHNGSFANSALNGYMYLTMGSYNGYAINWLITAFSDKLLDTTTPAGALLNTLTSKNQFLTAPAVGTNGLYCDSTLQARSFRLVSECVLGTSSGIRIFKAANSSSAAPDFGYKLYNVESGGDVMLQKTYEVTLDNYKTNNTLGLSSFSDIISQDIFCLSSSLASMLFTTVCYTIGTTSPTNWWCSDNATYSRVGETYSYNVYKNYFDATGSIATVHSGLFRYYFTNLGDSSVAECSTYSNTAGIRPALVVKLL